MSCSCHAVRLVGAVLAAGAAASGPYCVAAFVTASDDPIEPWLWRILVLIGLVGVVGTGLSAWVGSVITSRLACSRIPLWAGLVWGPVVGASIALVVEPDFDSRDLGMLALAALAGLASAAVYAALRPTRRSLEA